MQQERMHGEEGQCSGFAWSDDEEAGPQPCPGRSDIQARSFFLSFSRLMIPLVQAGTVLCLEGMRDRRPDDQVKQHLNIPSPLYHYLSLAAYSKTPQIGIALFHPVGQRKKRVEGGKSWAARRNECVHVFGVTISMWRTCLDRYPMPAF